MARKKPSMRDWGPIREAKAQKTIRNLSEHYERGLRGRKEFRRGQAQKLAEDYGVNIGTFRKERRFAELYSKDDLEELLVLRRPDGMPLHWGHVLYLITLEPKSVRRKFQKKAAKNGWSAPDLCDAIREYRPPETERGGRPVKVPEDLTAARRLLFQETERWVQRYHAISAQHAGDIFHADAAVNR